MEDRELDFDIARRNKAGSIAALRAVVAGYLFYLGLSMIRDLLRGVSTMSPVFVWIVGLVFIAAAVAFGFYTWKRWRADVEASRFPAPSEDEAPEE